MQGRLTLEKDVAVIGARPNGHVRVMDEDYSFRER